MGHYNFEKDLIDASNFEDDMEEFFSKLGAKVSRCKNSDYDLLVEYTSGVKERYELKDDLMAHRTGNFAIEFESRGKPSGISKTKSDYYGIRVGGNHTYIIPTSLIREYIEDKKYFRVVNGGDFGSNTKMYLFKIDIFQE